MKPEPLTMVASTVRGAPVGMVCSGCLAVSIILVAEPGLPQEALRNSLAGQAAAEARRVRPESLPYTIKEGDFRLLVTPLLGLDWNDNVNLSQDNPEEDFILRPMVQLGASYPLTQYNLLNFSIGFGYNKYFKHDELSSWYLQSGSELSFDVYVKDFWINLHDRFSYVQDSGREAAVANTGSYGTFENSAGLNITWDLQDLVPSLGYDHRNVKSTSDQFEQIDHASEMIVARAGARLHPTLTAGIEGTTAFTTYDKRILNDNVSYSAGVYADWQPGPALHVQPRAGYTIYSFDQTSQVLRAEDQNSWYADLTLSQQVTDAISYSLSAGHELRLGIQSDTIEDTYVRPRVNWNIIKDLTLTTTLFYEHGSQGAGAIPGSVAEIYDQFGGELGLSHPITSRLNLSLTYRLTLRASDDESRDYTQNMVGLLLTYQIR